MAGAEALLQRRGLGERKSAANGRGGTTHDKDEMGIKPLTKTKEFFYAELGYSLTSILGSCNDVKDI